MHSFLAAGSALCLTLLLAGTPARAALTASELALDEGILNQFNVVTFGDYTINSSGETEGRVAVGGNFTDNGGNICFNGCSGNTTSAALGATYGALNVWGSANGTATTTTQGANFYIQSNNNATLNMNGKGAVNIAGSNNGTISSPTVANIGASTAGNVTNLNGGTVHVSQPTTTTFPFATTLPFVGALTDLANSIQADAAATTPQTLGANGDNTVVTATAASGSYNNSKHYGFITTTMADLASQQNFGGINTNGLDAVFVVVTGASTSGMPNMNSNLNETNVIWDFVDATTLNFAGSWYGQILAPGATVSNPSGVLTGAVIANSIIQGGEIHQSTGSYFLPSGALSGLPTTTVISQSSPVVEPSALAVLFVGIFGLAFARRKTAHASA